MKRLSEFSFGDLLAAINKDRASSSPRTPATSETDNLQKQLADAQKEAQNALAEWRRYPSPYYELAWAEASDKVKRLEARLLKRKATLGG
jgi:acyl-CoA synthetase (AMP-forming)/AMP-acid ligase II